MIFKVIRQQSFLQTKTVFNTSSSTTNSEFKIPFGPFNCFLQKRWKKPINSAQTRLEGRTRDLKLDKLMTDAKKLRIVLQFQEIMSHRKRGPFVSVQLMSRWRNIVGLNITVGLFLNKYPHIFKVFTHPLRRNLCCKLTRKMKDLIKEEECVVKEFELYAVERIKKLLMMSTTGRLHVQALRLIRRELGLPKDFRDSILGKYSDDFRLIDLEIVELINRDENGLRVAEIENWRDKEYREKWLSEFETRYAFPINFPTGFKLVAGSREKLRTWQRLPYIKPYEMMEANKIRTCGGIQRFEKRVVGIIHELLSLTVEKMVEVERLAHFRKDYGITQVNVRELLLEHAGIFYISTKGSTQTVFLREAYAKGCLIEPNPIYLVRRKMLDLILLGCRNTRELQSPGEIKEGHIRVVGKADKDCQGDGDWVIPILEGFDNGKLCGDLSEASGLSEVEFRSENDTIEHG